MIGIVRTLSIAAVLLPVMTVNARVTVPIYDEAGLKAVKVLTPQQKKLRKDLLEGFEDAGVALPDVKRARVKEILDELEALHQEFERNVREDRTQVVFTPLEMKGLPQDYLDKATR